MKYLVQAEYIDPGALMPPEGVVNLVENLVDPSLRRLAELEQEGKLTGGLLAGERAGAFVVDASSNDEVSDLVAELPFWGVCRWKITPLEDWSHRLESDLRRLETLRAQIG